MNFSPARIAKMFTARAQELEFSEGEISRRSGIPQPTVHRILHGDSKNPHIENIAGIAKVLNLDISDVLGIREQRSRSESNVTPGPPMAGRLPLISWVQAGALCEAIDIYAPGFAEEWMDSPWPHSGSAFCLQVRGISMCPDYRDGEIIQVEPEITAGHGDDVIARTPEGEVTFKRLQITEDGQYLIAVNPDFPNRIIRVPEGTVICGVVTGSWIKRRNGKRFIAEK